MCFHSTLFSWLLSFFGIKSVRIAVMKLVPILNITLHITLAMAVCCSKFNLNFLKDRLDQLNNKEKLLEMNNFLKIASLTKKVRWKWPVPRSCFREAEQLAVYQLLPNLATWEDFEWLSSGSEPVSLWGPHINIMFMALDTIYYIIYNIWWQRPWTLYLYVIELYRVITESLYIYIYIDLIIYYLGTAVSYILLLPICKIELRVKRQLFWQPGDDFTMCVTPARCGWVGISGIICKVIIFKLTKALCKTVM